MARSPSNKGITNRNSAVPPAGRNYQDTTQAVRRIPGVAYGEQQDLIQQQQAAPLPKDTLPKEQPQVQAAQRQMPNIDVFAPTERPNEPITEGVPIGDGSSGVKQIDNIDLMLQAMYDINPSPIIMELINNRNR